MGLGLGHPPGLSPSPNPAERRFFILPTSKLQSRVSELLSVFLGGYTIRENIRPEWLVSENGNRLELDFFVEELNTAIEVQGEYHYRFVPFFHNDASGFKKRLELDRRKKEICEARGIRLFHIDNEQDALLAIDEMTAVIDQPAVPFVSSMMTREKSPKPSKPLEIPKIYGVTGSGASRKSTKLIMDISKKLNKHILEGIEQPGDSKRVEVIELFCSKYKLDPAIFIPSRAKPDAH